MKDERKATQLMKKGQGVWIALFSCLFAACVAAGQRITFQGDVLLKNTENYIAPISLKNGMLFLLTAGVTVLIVRRLVGVLNDTPRAIQREHPLRFACLCAALLLVGWSAYMLSIAPGNIYVDSLSSISQMLEHGHPTSNNHPQFYTLMVGVFLKIGTVLFGSVNIGVLLYSLFQTAVMILCIVSVLTLMYYEGISRWLLGGSLAYYLFVPLFPNYAMSMWKDPLFSCMLLMISLLLYLFWTRERAHWTWFAAYAVLSIGAMAMRNGVPYMIALVGAISAVLVRRYAKRLVIATAAALCIFLTMAQAATMLWNTHSDFVEGVGVPLQQLGYTINHGGRFTQEEEAYLYKLAPRDVWGYAYRPCLVDPLKWNPQFDAALLGETKGEFFRVWLGGMVKNPGKYMDAYLLATHGFWKPGVQNLYGYMDVQMNDNPYGIRFMDLFEKIFGFSILPALKDYPVFLGSGTLAWIMLLSCLLTCCCHKSGIMIYMPALLNWLAVMIGTPVAYSLRYVFVLALGLPLYLALPWMMAKRRAED